MTRIQGDERFRIPDDVVFREVAEESMILHLGSGIYFGLDEVGTRAWQLLAEHGSVDAVCAAMTEEFDASPATIRADVMALIDDLLAKNLLEVDA